MDAEKWAEVLKASAAQEREPLAYIVFLFSGLVVVLISLLVFRFTKQTQDRMDEQLATHSRAEDRRLDTIKQMADNCHTQSQKHMEMMMSSQTKTDVLIQENTKVLKRALEKL